MAREQARKQSSSTNHVSRRNYLRLSGAVAVGAAGTAVSGRAGDTGGTHSGDVLSVVGTTPTPSTYEVTVSDEIVPGRNTDALSVLGTTGQSAEDAIAEGVRSYRFTGEITDLRLDEGAAVFVNGLRVEPDAIGQ
ncbi:hypothetical protein [Salinigranum salinum]|uniref:hypothetical protein n=1 Tax=Salinigranum salinum TaxID=1364937 RepID=UPI0012608803|nr:hypothetical protein [Salinigranum salinum]